MSPERLDTMKKLRIALRSFADFEAALAAQLAAFPPSRSALHIEAVPLDLRSLEDAVLGANGLRSGAWDLAIFPTDWIGAAVQSLALVRLDPWMEADPLPDWPDGWPASLRAPLRQNGGFYCIPWHDGPECLIYRKDLFEDAGNARRFAAEFGRGLLPPTTWKEFHQTARFFTQPAQDLHGTLFAAYPDGHNTLYDLVLQVWSRHGELYSADGIPTLTDPMVVEALDFYRTIIRDPRACHPGGARIDSIHSGDIFLSGRIAMMVNWFGFAARCNQPDSPLSGRIALAPIPGGLSGQTASLSNYWVIAVGAGSKAQEAAYDLLRHIASAAMDKLTALHGAVGVRLSTWSDPDVLARFELYSELNRLSAQARTLPFCADLPRLAEIVNQITIDALSTDEPSASILERAQNHAIQRGLNLS
jgi:multiple sugar transport system substrate-binding protein